MLNRPLSILTTLLLLLTIQTRLYTDTIGIQIFRREGCWLFIDRLHPDPGHMSINAVVKLNLPSPRETPKYHL
jgi:hypothetical protein